MSQPFVYWYTEKNKIMSTPCALSEC